MKILQIKDVKQIKSILLAVHEGESYKRTEYTDNTVMWEPISYDGELEDKNGNLEKIFQLLLIELEDKKAESLKEIELCACGQHPESFCLQHCAH